MNTAVHNVASLFFSNDGGPQFQNPTAFDAKSFIAEKFGIPHHVQILKQEVKDDVLKESQIKEFDTLWFDDVQRPDFSPEVSGWRWHDDNDNRSFAANGCCDLE